MFKSLSTKFSSLRSKSTKSENDKTIYPKPVTIRTVFVNDVETVIPKDGVIFEKDDKIYKIYCRDSDHLCVSVAYENINMTLISIIIDSSSIEKSDSDVSLQILLK